MANDLVKFFGSHQVPERSKQREALAGFSAAKNSIMGKALLRLTKQGVWVFGQDNEVFSTKTQLIGNPASLSSGFVAWYLGKIEGEKMQPLAMGPVDASILPPVNSGSVPPGAKAPSGRGWEPQSSIDLVSNESIPLQMVYKTSSRGGMLALMTLAGDIAFAQDQNPKRVYPVIELGADSYQHSNKEYGTIFTPVLKIAGWLDETGEPVVETAQLMDKGRGLV